MAKKKAKQGKKVNKADSGVGGLKEGERFLKVDPARVRFQHSRIRPYFSGCGRSVKETLEQIRNKELSPDDLPSIQVIISPDHKDGKDAWYFSLNNRRLWVLKRCAEEGLLTDPEGRITVRARDMKRYTEEERYTVENCALEAKFMYEPKKKDKAATDEKKDTEKEKQVSTEISNLSLIDDKKNDDNEESDDESSDDDNQGYSNRFSGLM